MQHSTGGAHEKANAPSCGLGVRAGWAASARLAYVFLLAFVFPFVCWGWLGQAGHPHAGAHFVFAPPPGLETLGDQPAANPQPVAHVAHLALSAPLPDPANATGQSIPDTLSFFFLFLLIGATALRSLYTPTRARSLYPQMFGGAQQTPGLPLPPPRFA